MADVRPFTQREMMEQASRAVGRVLRDDLRGITTLSIDDITAMTGTLLALGLIATPPGETPPEQLIFTASTTQTKEAADGQ
ncbi:MAG: hypothetical protein ACK4IU_18385 [Tabrizicola flagellatus]|uniref:hypothetical protein n=1 Tax=Tabrizicola flagellatus TaxID=2593021 RepID=UPI00391B175D